METRAVKTTHNNVGELEECMASAVTGMSAFLEVLKEKAEELKTSPPAGVKATELTSAVRELAKAIMFAQEQKGKVDDVLRQESGGDGIDFDAARLEIGRRLDRIRDAEGPEVVP